MTDPGLDLTPTPEGFANIATTLATAVLSDVKPARRDAARATLRTLLEIVGYLATTDAAQ